MNFGEDVEKSEPLYTVGRTCNLLQPLWKTVWRFLKKLKIELSMAPSINLLGTYPEKKNENTNSKRYINPNVHSSTNDNGQDTKAMQMPMNRQMGREDMVYIYSAILHSQK